MDSTASHIERTKILAKHDQSSSGTTLVEHVNVWERDLKPIGKGGFGVVYREVCIKGHAMGQVRAVKKLPIKTDRSPINHDKELEAIAVFSRPEWHARFITSFGWYEDQGIVHIDMEYAPFGDLHHHLHHPLPVDEVFIIADQVFDAMATMHELGYVHRDLKPANLLVFQQGPQWHVKIADFGLTKRTGEIVKPWEMQNGTYQFIAPEMRGPFPAPGFSYTNALDIWALGVVGFLLLTKTYPFQDPPSLWQFMRLTRYDRQNWLRGRIADDASCKWIEECLEPRSMDRPTARDVQQYCARYRRLHGDRSRG